MPSQGPSLSDVRPDGRLLGEDRGQILEHGAALTHHRLGTGTVVARSVVPGIEVQRCLMVLQGAVPVTHGPVRQASVRVDLGVGRADVESPVEAVQGLLLLSQVAQGQGQAGVVGLLPGRSSTARSKAATASAWRPAASRAHATA